MNDINIKLLEIAGFASVLQALRLPYGKDMRSQADFSHREYTSNGVLYMDIGSSVQFDLKDLSLMQTLVRNGDEHAKVMRGLIVYLEITAPRFWWVEMDTYRIGAERLSSESTMHIQGKGLSTEELVRMKSELQEGTMQKRVEYFSYQTLRRIYFQRKDHRLPHWHQFCSFIEGLPFASTLILCQRERK